MVSDTAIQAKEYLDRERINISLSVAENKIIIQSSIVPRKIIAHVFLIVCVIIGTANINQISLTMLLLILSVILHVVWQDFESINDIIIYEAEKKLVIKRKNIIKRQLLRLLSKKDEYAFTAVSKIEVFVDPNGGAGDKKYVANLILKNKNKIKLLSVQREKHAAYIVNFLSQLVNTV